MNRKRNLHFEDIVDYLITDNPFYDEKTSYSRIPSEFYQFIMDDVKETLFVGKEFLMHELMKYKFDSLSSKKFSIMTIDSFIEKPGSISEQDEMQHVWHIDTDSTLKSFTYEIEVTLSLSLRKVFIFDEKKYDIRFYIEIETH